MTSSFDGTNSIPKYWDKYVPQKCMDLYSFSPKISENAFYTMTSMVDGVRLLRHSDNSCYLVDPNEVPQEAIKNSDFVTKIYDDVTRHRTLTVPVKKTVIEYDKSKINEDQLNKFWTNWSTNDQCSLETKPLREKLQSKRNELSKLQDRLIKLWGNDALNLNFSEVYSNLKNRKDEYVKIIQDAKVSLADYQNKITNLKKEIAQLSSQIKFIEDKITKRENDLYFEQNTFEQCKDIKNLCYENKGKQNAVLDTLYNRNSDLRSSIKSYNEHIDTITNKLRVSKEKLNVCDYQLSMTKDSISNISNDIDNYRGMRDTCRSTLSDYKVTLQEYKDDFNKYEVIYNECKSQTPILQDKYDGCKDELRDCANVLKGISGCNVDIRDYNVDNMSEAFDPIQEKISELTKQADTYQTKYQKCYEQRQSIQSEIEELKDRNKIMKSEKERTLTELDKLHSLSQDKVSELYDKANQDSVSSHKKHVDEQIQRQTKEQCSNEDVELKAKHNSSKNKNESLKMKLRDITNPQKSCKDDCELDLSQCIVHSGHPEICTKRGSSDNTLESEPKEEGKIEVSVFDQEKEEIKKFTMSNSGEAECIYRTGIQDLTSFEVRNLNQDKKTNMTLFFKAGTGACLKDPTPSKFRNPESTLENSRQNNPDHRQNRVTNYYQNYESPQLIGGVVVDKTVYRKINLYRGTESITFLLA